MNRMMMCFPMAVFAVFTMSQLQAKAVDLKDHPQVQEVGKWLRDNVAQGNEREAAVEKLDFDPATGKVETVVRIRNRQVSGHIYNPFSRQHVPVIAYAWTVTGSATFNARNGQLNGKIDCGRGISVDIGTLGSQLGGLIK